MTTINDFIGATELWLITNADKTIVHGTACHLTTKELAANNMTGRIFRIATDEPLTEYTVIKPKPFLRRIPPMSETPGRNRFCGNIPNTEWRRERFSDPSTPEGYIVKTVNKTGEIAKPFQQPKNVIRDNVSHIQVYGSTDYRKWNDIKIQLAHQIGMADVVYLDSSASMTSVYRILLEIIQREINYTGRVIPAFQFSDWVDWLSGTQLCGGTRPFRMLQHAIAGAYKNVLIVTDERDALESRDEFNSCLRDKIPPTMNLTVLLVPNTKPSN